MARVQHHPSSPRRESAIAGPLAGATRPADWPSCHRALRRRPAAALRAVQRCRAGPGRARPALAGPSMRNWPRAPRWRGDAERRLDAAQVRVERGRTGGPGGCRRGRRGGESDHAVVGRQALRRIVAAGRERNAQRSAAAPAGQQSIAQRRGDAPPACHSSPAPAAPRRWWCCWRRAAAGRRNAAGDAVREAQHRPARRGSRRWPMIPAAPAPSR